MDKPTTKYWLLKSVDVASSYDVHGKREVEYVEARECNFDMFKASVLLKPSKVHGRRINDEVELFQWHDGKEAPGLREELEKQGLTVRTYVPEPNGKKFPTATPKTPGGQSSTQCERRVQALKNTIAEFEEAEGTKIDFAVLADAGKTKRVMLICKFRRQDFLDFYRDGIPQTFTSCGGEYRVLGCVEGGKPRLKSDEDLGPFFKERDDGDHYHVDVQYCDLVARQEAADKAEKKRAKKHRRQVTASTTASPDGKSLASETTTASDESVKARQKEKAKKKRREQRKRKREQAGGAGDADPEVQVRIFGTGGATWAMVEDTAGHRILHNKPGKYDLNSLKKIEADVKKCSLQDESSSSEDEGRSSGSNLFSGGLEVKQVNTIQEMRDAIRSAEGPVYCMNRLGSDDEAET